MKKKQPSLTEHVLVNSGVILLFTLLASPFGYLIRIIFSRSLPPEAYGLFYALLGFFALFVNYKDLGFGNAALYFIPKYWHKKDYQQTWLAFAYAAIAEIGSSLLIAGVAIASSGLLARLYFKSELAIAVLPIFAVIFVLESITLSFKRLFVGLKKVAFYSSFEPLRFSVTFFLSGYLFVTGQTSLVAFSLIWLVSYLVTVGLCLVLFMTKLKMLLGPLRWRAELFTQLKSYALPNLVNSFVHQINNNTDVMFLTLVKGVTAVGVYNVTFPIMVIPSMFFSPLTRLFFPMMSSLQEEAGGKEKIRHFIESTLRLIPFVSLYFNIFIFLFAEPALATLFTYKWVEVAKTPLTWMAIAYLGFILVSYLGFIIDGLGLVKQKVKITSALAVVNMVATPLAIYFFDLLGLIAVNGVVQLVLVVLFVRLLAQHYHFSMPYQLYGKYVAFFGALVILVKVLGVMPKTFWAFMATGMFYTAVVGLFALNQQLVDSFTIELLKTKFLKGRVKRL